MARTPSRWVLVCTALAATFIGVVHQQGTAAACSCEVMSPSEVLNGADAAFVGSLIDIVPDDTDSSRVVARYEVHEVVKGDFGDVAVVLDRAVDDSDDDLCLGLPLSRPGTIGVEAGIVLGRWDQVGAFTPQSACSGGPFTPDELRAAALAPGGPASDGPIQAVVAGPFGWGHLIAVDAQGAAVAYGLEPANSISVSVCPDGKSIAELLWNPGENGTLQWRDLTTFAVVASTEVAGRGGEVTCLTFAGAMAAVVDADDGGVRIVGLDSAQDVPSAPFPVVDPLAQRVYGHRSGEIVGRSLGSTHVVFRAQAAGKEERIVAIAPSPDALTLAVVVTNEAREGAVLFIDTETGAIDRHPAGTFRRSGSLFWVDDETVAFTVTKRPDRGLRWLFSSCPG